MNEQQQQLIMYLQQMHVKLTEDFGILPYWKFATTMTTANKW
jgi:hypothetical protein